MLDRLLCVDRLENVDRLSLADASGLTDDGDFQLNCEETDRQEPCGQSAGLMPIPHWRQDRDGGSLFDD